MFRFDIGRRRVDSLQVPGHFLALFPTHIVQRVPYQVHDAQQYSRSRKDTLNRFREAFQSVHTRDEDVGYAPILQLRDHLQPEFRALCLRNPQPQNLLQPVQRDPDRQINRFVLYVSVISDFELDGVLNAKKLLVIGGNFDEGATVIVNGEKEKTANDEDNPASKLIAKKAGKKIFPGVLVASNAAPHEFLSCSAQPRYAPGLCKERPAIQGIMNSMK